MPSVFQELKQRRIVQIVASTAVSGWVVLEVVSGLVERGILPEIVYRVGFVIFLGGLAVGFVTGWYHGEKGHQRATRTEVVLLALIALVTGFFSVQTVRAGDGPELGEGRFEADRVAVLYFGDRSRDGGLAYLADGLTESLHERLEGVSSLDVVSLSGSAQVRDRALSVDSIASLLESGTVVDGWVEPRGDEVRITVVLYDGDSGAEQARISFDRPADEVFALQDDLSEEVAASLRERLGERFSLRRAQVGTQDVQAWTAFRRGQRARREAEESIDGGDVQGFIDSFTRADSLFAFSEQRDPAWAEPTVLRAILASRWGELSAPEDPVEGREYMELAVSRADQALGKDPRNAQAYFVRGTVRFLVWYLGLAPSAAAADEAFEQARADLEQATTLDPRHASAFSTLSILYSQIPDPVEANLAARRAFEADEFLRSADSVLRRLYQTSYDLEQWQDAITYCDLGHQRFPDQPEFVQCELWLRGAPRGLAPDPDEAWALLERHLARVPPADRPREEIRDRLLVAMVLARAGMADSARAVIATTSVDPEVDPDRELLGVEALVHLALDDPDTAVERLKVYLTASPEHRAGWQWSSHWWWRPLRANPEFQRIIGG
ncbi:MAG: hypothetical protein RH859_05585 [Longimicrobiales bacterium]